jgi:hypothetical protein
MTPTTLGGLHVSRTAGTTSFKVLVSPPPLGLVAQAVGCRSLLSSTPSGIGAEVEALADRSSATAFSTRGNVLQVQDLKVLFHLARMEQIGSQLRVIPGAISLDLLDNELGVSFHEELPDRSNKAVLNPKSRASYSAMLLVALKSRCTMYLIWSPCGERSTTPAPAPCLREEPSK